MTESQLNRIHQFVTKKLEKDDNFTTTSSELMNIAFGEKIVKGHGHKKFFNEFLNYGKKLNTKYDVKAINEDNSDCHFHILIKKL